MKKFLTTALSLIMLTSLAVPAHAWGDSYNWHWWDWLFNISSEESEKNVLSAPKITQAIYCHKNSAYSGFDNHLQILWDEIEDADNYEVEITKADGAVDTYTTDGPCLYEKTDCPKVYMAETNTWTSATVRVRALSDDDASDWSDSVTISCNAFHHTK